MEEGLSENLEAWENGPKETNPNEKHHRRLGKNKGA
jgi:hypothetical protein